MTDDNNVVPIRPRRAGLAVDNPFLTAELCYWVVWDEDQATVGEVEYVDIAAWYLGRTNIWVDWRRALFPRSTLVRRRIRETWWTWKYRKDRP